MKESLTKNPGKILSELKKVIDGKKAITLYMKGKNPWQTKILDIQMDEEWRLRLEKPKSFIFAPDTHYFVLYHATDKRSGSMNGFESVVVDDGEDVITLDFPGELFAVFQRKHKRLETSGNSRAKFLIPPSEKVVSGILKDTSMEGSCLLLDNRFECNKGTHLGALTLTLCLRSNPEEVEIVAQDAEIVRASQVGGNIKEIAVHFLLTDSEREKMQKYIDTRLLEENLGEELPDF